MYNICDTWWLWKNLLNKNPLVLSRFYDNSQSTHQSFRDLISKRCHHDRICETYSNKKVYLEFVLQSLSRHLKMSDTR